MGLLTRLLDTQAAAPNATDDFWYQPFLGGQGGAGVRVNAETAQLSSAVFASVRLIAETLATLPLIVYRRLPDDSRERATDHPVYRVLHDRPNSYQTPFEFKEYMQRAALLRGNGVAVIVPGRNGAVDELIPWHPDKVKIERVRIGTLPNGVEQIVPRYVLTLSDRTTVTLNRDDVFHHRGFSRDGVTGVSVIEYARETIGLSLATESYGARFFSQNAKPGGVLQHQGRLSEDAAKRLKRDWELMHTGLDNAHRVAILEEGLTWQSIGMTNEDAQFLASREFQIADISRWFGVPLHMLNAMTKSTSWGSGIEQLSMGFLLFTEMPWLRRWEQAVTRDLLVDTDAYFIEFLVDALLRGDQKSRYAAYAVGRQWGWLSANDIRKWENQNPIDGGDVYMSPLNMADAGQASTAIAEPPNTAHYDGLLHQAAARVVRKEVTALTRMAKRTGADSDFDAFNDAAGEFYADHAGLVADSLGISLKVAERYTAEQRQILFHDGPDALGDWETDRLDRLIALTTEAQNE